MKIAITRTEKDDKLQYYIDWLKANEDIDTITLSAVENNLDELNKCDALVLTGGIDIHPKFYGGNTIYTGAPEKFNEKRDEFEITTFHSAQKNNLPILGICRGMQLINVIQTGTLIQDHDDENLHEIHKGNPDKYHHVNIEEGSLLHEIIGFTKGEINSAHHQAIDLAGKDLLINCKADDGTIEGVEWKDKTGKPFMLAVQWHPERMFKQMDSPFSKKLRGKFILEVEKSISAKNDHH
ncbi:MAG: gamma-glutamyl-gamma-aminobutyrate hydrolase family protein [Ginsengibacter sp.]